MGITHGVEPVQGSSAAEDPLQLVTDSAPALIHTGLPDGYLDFFNQSWLNYLGLSLEDVAGWKWTAAIHPEDVAAIVETWRTARPPESPSYMKRVSGGLTANTAGCCTTKSRFATNRERLSSGTDQAST